MQSPITKETTLQEIEELAPPCACSACSHGCTMGSGILAEGDLPKLAAFLGISQEEAKERFLEKAYLFGKERLRPKILRKEGKTYGKCIFHEEDGKCRVHEAKPLQCKVAMGCSPYGEDLMLWFMANHLVDVHDEGSMREYGTYLKSGGRALRGSSLEEMKEEAAKR